MLEVGEVILCVVDRIIGTTVFVKIPYKGQELEGSINFSEISPGRIRNIRDFVVPKKTIFCKVLRISGDRIDLSFRRVTPKEQKEVKDRNQQEKSCKKIFQSVLGEKAEPISEKICENEDILEFMASSKKDIKQLEKYFDKESAKKIFEILNSQKAKIATIKKEFQLKSKSPNGISEIKEILLKIKNAEIKYISAGKYSIKTEAEEIKIADSRSRAILEDIEKQAKKLKMEFNVK